MTDNFQFTQGSGATGAAKDIGGGVLAPKVIATESDGTDTGLAAKLGAVTETAPATDTASSGLNGRLQRIAQRLTTLIGSTIAVSGTFWQATQPVSAASLPLPTGAAQESGGNLATIASAISSSKMAVKAASGDFADGADTTIGTKADAKNSATDTTAVSGISIWKQISASVQAIATSIAGTITVATHAVTQSGTWTVQPGNTANTTAWKVDGSAVTQPASIADGSLTTLGAKADAKNSATDTTSISVMSVLKQISFSIQAAASSLAGTLTVAAHNVTNAGTFAVQATEADGANTTLGSKADAKNSATDTTAITAMSVWKQISASVQAIATSVAGTLTVATHAVTQSGTWNVTVNAAIAAGTNLIGKFGIDQTTPGTTNGVSIAQIGANTVLTGNGTAGTGAQRVTIASDNTAFSVNATTVPATSGGLSTFHLASAGSTNATNIKASAGQLYGYMISNTSAAYSYVAFHNSASAPTAGASIFFKIGLPAGGAANVEFSNGVAFSSGIGITTVTGAADSNTTAVAANDLIINVFYK